MSEISISDTISYIPSAADPLSADIGIIRAGGAVWLYDVGCGDSRVFRPDIGCKIVLSHFHPDHTGNLDKIPFEELYVSKETRAHVGRGTLVSGSVRMGNLHIFPLPSSHAKGCLGLEVDGTYAFVGDALYCRHKNGRYVYNAQVLKDEIQVLKGLSAPYLLVSHHPGLIRRREEVMAQLEAIYNLRSKNEPEIEVTHI